MVIVITTIIIIIIIISVTFIITIIIINVMIRWEVVGILVTKVHDTCSEALLLVAVILIFIFIFIPIIQIIYVKTAFFDYQVKLWKCMK